MEKKKKLKSTSKSAKKLSNIEAKKIFFETNLFPGEKGRNSAGDLAFDDITNFNAQVSRVANMRRNGSRTLSPESGLEWEQKIEHRDSSQERDSQIAENEGS